MGQNSLLFNREVSRSQKTQKWTTLRKSFCINILQRKDDRFQQRAAPFASNGALVCVKRSRRLRQPTCSMVSNDALTNGNPHAQTPQTTALRNTNADLWSIRHPTEAPFHPFPFRYNGQKSRRKFVNNILKKSIELQSVKVAIYNSTDKIV